MAPTLRPRTKVINYSVGTFRRFNRKSRNRRLKRKFTSCKNLEPIIENVINFQSPYQEEEIPLAEVFLFSFNEKRFTGLDPQKPNTPPKEQKIRANILRSSCPSEQLPQFERYYLSGMEHI